MLKQTFTILLLAMIPGVGFANNPIIPIASSVNPVEITPPCNLPAPENPHYEQRGPNWLTFRWTALSPLVQHRVKTYTVIGNNLVSNLIVPAGQQSVKITGLLQNVAYYSTVNAICPDGVDSQYLATGGPDTTILSELIVSGYNGSTGDPSCGVSSPNEYCNFIVSTQAPFSIFKIFTSSEEKSFGVRRNADLDYEAVILNNEGNYQFKIDYQTVPPDKVGVNFQIYHFGTLIAVFQLYEHKPQHGQVLGRLLCVNMSPNYQILRLTPAPSGMQAPPSNSLKDDKSNDRSEMASSPTSIAASPNPFSETLEVFLPHNTIEKVSLQLFNLSGQKVLDRIFADKQEHYLLPTADLSPGFYLLRIEADGVVQTLKVVKSE